MSSRPQEMGPEQYLLLLIRGFLNVLKHYGFKVMGVGI